MTRLGLDPGGFAWLLRHELRLALRGSGKRTGWWTRLVPLLLLAALPVAGGVMLAFALTAVAHHARRLPPHAAESLATLLGVGAFGLFVIMLSTASIAVLRTFHDRGDLDLLLSSPLPPARILRAKAAGVVVSVAAPFVVLIAPFTIASAILGQPGWLGGLAVAVIAAVMATALALVLTALLFDAVGPRRARTIVQLGAAVTGGAAFLLTQAANFAPDAAPRLFRSVIAHGSALRWAGRAAIGDLVPLATLAVIAVAAVLAASRFAARHLAASADRTDRQKALARPLAFRTGVTRIVVVKELRLIARDPELITQVALRLIYLIPLAALILRGTRGGDVAGLAGAATGFAALLTSSLAWIIVCAEDAPDLIAAAPIPPAGVFRAKLLAAGIIPAAIVTTVAAALAVDAGWTAIVTLAVAGVAIVTAALLQAWFGRPAARSAFRRRQSGSFAVGVGEVVMAGAWSGTATLLARGSVWAVAPALLGAMIMAGAIEARKTA